MEMENMVSNRSITKDEEEDDDDVTLPGFRFHPTDEELVSFYLRRKVENKKISIELIKTIDIYKYDPWDLPKGSNVGEKEWYFFCKRGRKYRNSVRPNRVTGCGFWKATGIDKPIYDQERVRDCIGLKKSLVFYRGSAGKGTKTDWMMHEFRLPSDHDKSSNHFHCKTIAQEAEVWTLCRIFKRNMSNRKIIPDWKEITASKRTTTPLISSKTCDMAGIECNNNIRQQSYSISFNNATPSPLIIHHEKIPFNDHPHVNYTNQHLVSDQLSSISQHPSNSSGNSSFMSTSDINEILKHGDWEELSSVVEFAADRSLF